MRANFQSPPDNIFLSQIPLNILTDAPKTTASIGGGTVRTSASGTPSRSGACLPASHSMSNRRPETSSESNCGEAFGQDFLQRNRRPDCDGSAKRSLAPATEIRARLLPQGGGAARIPAIRPRTKRLLPNEKSQSPRTTGRGCPTICRQPLRYGFPAATSPKSGVNGCGTSPHSIFRTRRR